MSTPLNASDNLIKSYVDSNEYGAFLEVFVYEDENGNEYRICCDQDGGETIEE